jgi:hypothetical protein
MPSSGRRHDRSVRIHHSYVLLPLTFPKSILDAVFSTLWSQLLIFYFIPLSESKRTRYNVVYKMCDIIGRHGSHFGCLRRINSENKFHPRGLRSRNTCHSYGLASQRSHYQKIDFCESIPRFDSMRLICRANLVCNPCVASSPRNEQPTRPIRSAICNLTRRESVLTVTAHGKIDGWSHQIHTHVGFQGCENLDKWSAMMIQMKLEVNCRSRHAMLE